MYRSSVPIIETQKVVSNYRVHRHIPHVQEHSLLQRGFGKTLESVIKQRVQLASNVASSKESCTYMQPSSHSTVFIWDWSM